MPRILIVDDEVGVREAVRIALSGAHDVTTAPDGTTALARAAEEPVDLVLLDLVMPGMDGLDVLRRLRAAHPTLPVLMLTATRTVRSAVDAMKHGAADYLTKPFDVDELLHAVRRALLGAAPRAAAGRAASEPGEVGSLPLARGSALPRERRGGGVSDVAHGGRAGAESHVLLGESPRMLAVRGLIDQVARRRATVLVTGESGTGKEVVARAIHAASPRAAGPFVAVNCAAIPDGLVESELFGHERGAFTDAKSARPGRFEQAHDGTLFLDEVGDLPLAAQAKLLRALEEPAVVRVGGTRSVAVDVRLVAATNRDLRTLVAERRFREDLYYRLAVVPLALPPLRERREDVPVLARYFLERHADDLPGARFTEAAFARLSGHDWPGNVRELRNVVERAVALSVSPVIGPEALPLDGGDPRAPSVSGLRDAVLDGGLPFDEAEAEFERQLIVDALARSGFVQTRAAQLLGISRRILKYKMDKLGIREPAA
jgi:DNA-binding NtrC family response regulator